MPSGIDIEDVTIGDGPAVERGQIVSILAHGVTPARSHGIFCILSVLQYGPAY